MTQPPIGRILTDLERQIQDELRSEPHFRDPRISRLPTVRSAAMMPEYVEHSDAATEIGRLSAEAVVSEYESAAKEIEAMGSELLKRVKQCEIMTAEALRVTEELKEVATRYRAEAARVSDHIESCSFLVANVRKTCIELRDRIATPGDPRSHHEDLGKAANQELGEHH
jgi:hypothetical protein